MWFKISIRIQNKNFDRYFKITTKMEPPNLLCVALPIELELTWLSVQN